MTEENFCTEQAANARNQVAKRTTASATNLVWIAHLSANAANAEIITNQKEPVPQTLI